MFWIKAHKGNLINLALATDIFLKTPSIDGDHYRVSVFFGDTDSESTLLIGSKEQCEDYRRRLWEHLSIVSATLDVPPPLP